MERQKNRPIWALLIILLIVFLIGMACEILLKLFNVMMNTRMAERPEIIANLILRGFGDEAIPLWAIPALVLNWMSIMPRAILPYALRWLPYLILFLLPVLCAVLRHRAIPLIVCAVVSGITAVGIVLVRFVSRMPLINVYAAIPFAVETLMLVLACIALGVKKKGFAIVLGVFFVLLALASPAVSAVMAGMRANALPAGVPIGQFLKVQLKRLPLSAAVSYWPIFKTFAFLMYALILFVAPSRFPRRAKA